MKKKDDYTILDTSPETELPTHESSDSEANNPTASASASASEEVKIDLENRNNDNKIAIDPQRLERITAKLSNINVRDGENSDPTYRIDTIVRSTKDSIANLYCFNDKSVEQLIGLVNFTFKGDNSVFTNDILPNREDYGELGRLVINGNIADVLGGGRQEGIDIGALDLEDKAYLFAKSLKELLSDNEWRVEAGINLNEQELNRVQLSIDEGAEYLANPSAYRTFMSCIQSPSVQEFLAPTLNLINYARENPGNAAFNALAIGTSITWGSQEGFPVDLQMSDNVANHFGNALVNAFVLAGLVDTGTHFADDVRQALSGNNPLGRRMVQLGAIALGAYLANQNDRESVGAAEAFSMIGAAMAGISTVAFLDNFANRARPLVSSRATQFAELVSNSLGNLLPSNNVQAVQAQGLNQQQNDIEVNNRI